ncbi:ribokinase [Nocardioides houyundeii]|uniref:ribokinase n=1 Tax=Nocardioides houyundeii TaxID=2045452 RepID=UPI000C771345|nr:ribokinase [Nocardioides houyundeii]
MTRPRVLVVGSFSCDTMVRVEHLPREGETSRARTLARLPGGKGNNQAVAMARLGARVSMVGAVGDDDEGRMILAALQEEDVDVRHVRVTDGSTGIALVMVDDAADNTIIIHGGANDTVTCEQVDEALAEARATGVRYDAVVLQHELDLDVVAHTISRAVEVSDLLVLNAAPAARVAQETLALVDVLVVNEHEARVVAGEDDPKGSPWDPVTAVARLRERVGGLAVITLGSAGGVLAGEQESTWSVPPGVEAVDTTGAGDAFVGALVDGLIRGMAAGDAAQRAAAAAALAVQAHGAQSALPRADALDC